MSITAKLLKFKPNSTTPTCRKLGRQVVSIWQAACQHRPVWWM